MVELVVVGVLCFWLGIACGVMVPYTIRFPVAGCKNSPTGFHEFNQLQGYYATCQFCTARKKFLNG